MPEDVEEHVAEMFHGLVSELQRNDVTQFEQERAKEAALRAELRRANPHQGLNAGELLKKLDGDPEVSDRKMQADLDRIDRDAKVSAEKVAGKRDPLPEGHFPPPPESG